MSLPHVLLYDNNISDVSFRTGWTEETLVEALKFYKARGIYPVKVPLPIGYVPVEMSPNETVSTSGKSS